MKMDGIYGWVINNKIKQPIKLELTLDKVVYDPHRQGKDTRYFKVCIGDANVSQMVANATNLKISKAKGTYNDLIIHGSGMDMGFALQDRMYRAAVRNGHPNMFDRSEYIYRQK